ncbi:phage portal protein [Jeotgalibaca porci]|uniref:phage portal protein n=1 Tax=Jeotgalibaca porci TaxID=1868793 RepID=UPI00359FCDF2
MGFLDAIFKRNSELGFMFDMEMFEDKQTRIHMKHLAVETCAAFLARTISQSEFKVKTPDGYAKEEVYYRLNVRPNKNQSASEFWEKVIIKMIYDNEVLVIQTDDGDLVIADDYEQNSYAVYENTFTHVIVGDYEFKRPFRQGEVLHLQYSNMKLQPLIDGIFKDYGDLFGTVFSSQKRKNQIRSTVDMDMIAAKSPEKQNQLQSFIDNMYQAIRGNFDVAIVPQQPGFKYEEVSSGNSSSQSVDEINKLTNGFLDQVAMALGIPITLLHGEKAGVKEVTKNYMLFTVKPLLKKIRDECNSKLFTMTEFLVGNSIEIKTISFESIFDLANSIDKIVSSGAFTRNEVRDEVPGFERVDDPELDKFIITKNYQKEGEQTSEKETE